MHRITSYLICLILLLFVFSCSDISLKDNTDGDLESGENTIIADCDYDFGGDDDLDRDETEQNIGADQDIDDYEDIISYPQCDRSCEDNYDCRGSYTCDGWVCNCITKKCEKDDGSNSNRDCYGREYCDASADCTDICHYCDLADFLCYPQECRENADCCPGTACMGGVCVDMGDYNCGNHIVISGMTLIAEDKTVQLEIALYNELDLKLYIGTLVSQRCSWKAL